LSLFDVASGDTTDTVAYYVVVEAKVSEAKVSEAEVAEGLGPVSCSVIGDPEVVDLMQTAACSVATKIDLHAGA
jgi:hypothetical protein